MCHTNKCKQRARGVCIHFVIGKSGIIMWYVMNSFLTCMHEHVCALYQAAPFRDENGHPVV